VKRPEVSVVIPTKDREARLAVALEGLARQTLSRARFEVIVVRAGVEGELTEAPDGFDVRFLERRESRGAAAQRNAGWLAASGDLVAFLDDDCRPEPDWLERLLDERDDGHVLLQGRTEPDPNETSDLYGLARSVRIVGPSDWFETCNIAYPRSLLERLGGFDERFPHAWGEDTDLGLRALESGAELRYVDGARVWHAVHRRSLPAALREAVERDSLPAVIARHPAHRGALELGLFARKAHGLLLLALAGGIIFRRRPALALLTAWPYLTRHLEPSNGWLRGAARVALDLPVRVPVDLLEVAALARSSARHRCLVL
jgi:GT2 family glycosyltransferase